MSDYAVLADVSETLLRLLRTQMTGLVAADHIALASPADVELDTAPWLTVFLYQVIESPYGKTGGFERVDASQQRPAPTIVDLVYLVVPYAQTRENEYQMLGRVVQIFASQPIIAGSWLQGTLAGTGEELRVMLHPLPMEELLRLWNAFPNKPYKLSVCYLVSSVAIDSSRPAETFPAVVTRELNVNAP
jgi:uncharacterized protein DUF4255